MKRCLGLDTSNYTTSAALFDGQQVTQAKRPLPVRDGELGLRQQEAVFHHVVHLPEVLEQLLDGQTDIDFIAASSRPRQVEGSYMPCFLAGYGAARQLAAALGVPVYAFSHQQGHVAAAALGSGKIEWLNRRFLAFHLSGGTTDALLVEPDEQEICRCTLVGGSLDLKAGQLIDRVGRMLGLPFPAGPALEQLALQAQGQYKPKVPVKDGYCHLSGVENQCRAMKDSGAPDAEVALFCIKQVEAALVGMTQWVLRQFGELPLLYAGGVMSNSLIRESITAQFGGVFAPPAFAADNAAGIALLGYLKSCSTV